MRTRRFHWEGAAETAGAIRAWASGVGAGGRRRRRSSARSARAATRRCCASPPASTRPSGRPTSLRVEAGEPEQALAALDPALRESLEVAAANVRAVAEAQVEAEPRRVDLPQGQSVTVREVAGRRRRHLRARAGAPPTRRAS